jgi:hypothetical protein
MKYINVIIVFYFLCLQISCAPQNTPRPVKPGITQKHHRNKVNKTFLKIPSWYIEKPEISGVNLSYAYSARYMNEETEMKTLLISAARNIQIAKETRMIVMHSGNTYSDTFTGGTKVVECDVDIDEDILADKYSIIKQFPIENGILAIAAEKCQLKKIKSHRISNILKKLDITSPPKWAIKPPAKKGFVYGVGLSPSYSSPEMAWDVAEQNARADIVLQKIVKIKNDFSSNKQSYFDYTEDQSKLWSSIVLKNVSIIKHGYCKKDKTYYALARMKE